MQEWAELIRRVIELKHTTITFSITLPTTRGQNVSIGNNLILKKSSDAAQKLMERYWGSDDAVDEQQECDCVTGKEDPMFKLHYRGQMIGLIRKIIGAVCDPNHDCTGDTKHETNLKNEMKIVRSLNYP